MYFLTHVVRTPSKFAQTYRYWKSLNPKISWCFKHFKILWCFEHRLFVVAILVHAGARGGKDQRGTTQKTVRWLVADSYRVCLSLSLLLYIYAYVHIIQAWTRAYPCSEHGWTKPGGQSDTRLEHSVFEQFFSRLFVRVSLRRAVERWLEFSRFSRLLSFMWGSQPRRARVFSFVRCVFTFLVFSASAGSSFLKLFVVVF